MVSEFTGAHKKTKIETYGKPRKRPTAVKVLAIMRLQTTYTNHYSIVHLYISQTFLLLIFYTCYFKFCIN